MSAAVVLFTRDLRVRDNAALTAAAWEADAIAPLFVLDEELLAGSCGSPNRVAYLLDALRDLDGSLRERGARLLVRRGDPVQEAMAVATECGASAIHLSDDHGEYGRRREERLRRACEPERVEVRAHPGATVAEPGEVLPTGGDHYRVFTPYWRAWRELPGRRPPGAPRSLTPVSGPRVGRIPAADRLAAGSPSPDLIRGGEGEARTRLDRWVRGGLSSYEERHDDLPGDATSRLSADLHFGCLAPAAVLARVRERPGGGPFARQLCWRDFHHQVLAAHPDMPRAEYRPRGDRWRRRRGPLEAWRAGRTGYPLVDAGMRQLLREGFMHNRARMLVASFLAKTLYTDWRLGAAHFARLLVDADVANNVGNWQWVAGTGNDSRPNRVLNPLRQAHRFDPGGAYVRRYVPELEGVEGVAVHEPWNLAPAERRRLDYPDPIVDHVEAAAELKGFRSSGVG